MKAIKSALICVNEKAAKWEEVYNLIRTSKTNMPEKNKKNKTELNFQCVREAAPEATVKKRLCGLLTKTRGQG